jgi:hypothetical protein
MGEDSLKKRVTVLGRDVDSGWRAENKAAAMAAWLVVAGISAA